jgi:hypothetical protein
VLEEEKAGVFDEQSGFAGHYDRFKKIGCCEDLSESFGVQTRSLLPTGWSHDVFLLVEREDMRGERVSDFRQNNRKALS